VQIEPRNINDASSLKSDLECLQIVVESEESEEGEESDDIAEIMQIDAIADIVEVSSSEEAITTHQPDDGLAMSEISKVHIDEIDVGATEEMDRVSEWVMDPLDDAPMKTMGQLEELAMESLQSARKNKIYHDESLFAALVDFYRWAPRYGRGKAAMRVARNRQRGPAFARRVCSQARYFEAHGMLEASCQGKRNNVGLMGVEELKIGIRRYLRTMSAGVASVRPFF
jgi:hypothetical protein